MRGYIENYCGGVRGLLRLTNESVEEVAVNFRGLCDGEAFRRDKGAAIRLLAQ